MMNAWIVDQDSRHVVADALEDLADKVRYGKFMNLTLKSHVKVRTDQGGVRESVVTVELPRV